MNRIRTYSELIQLKTFSERFEYLKLNGHIGLETFGADRYLNQRFYSNVIWKKLRHEIIVRDNACDLGIDSYEIPDKEPIYIHHMNPISIEDIVDMNEYVLNPEYLISTSARTHRAIHYGEDLPSLIYRERRPFDTCPWR